MIQIKSVNPFSRKSKIKCGFCGLTYSARDYRIYGKKERFCTLKIQLPSQKGGGSSVTGVCCKFLKSITPITIR